VFGLSGRRGCGERVKEEEGRFVKEEEEEVEEGFVKEERRGGGERIQVQRHG